MSIIAATDFSTRSNRAVRQAGLLARANGAELHLLHVVDEDQPESLVRMEQREAEQLLAEQISSMPELQGVQVHHRVIAGDAFDGILRAAAEIGPELLVMGSHRKQLLRDIFVGTTIERVIRRGTHPVLMVNNEAQQEYKRVVIPVDLSDASAHAIRISQRVGLVAGEQATLVHAFVAPARGKLTIGGYDPKRIESYIAIEGRMAREELTMYLAANNLGNGWQIRLEEGTPTEVISTVVRDTRPELLVMGTHSRSAIIKAIIGSVTEDALRSLEVDILVVPPPH